MLSIFEKIKQYRKTREQKKSGYVIVLVLGIVTILLIIVTGLAQSVINEYFYSNQEKESLQSMQIAEAGLNYYTWFLGHNEDDWQDGLGIDGPYFHDYFDGDGNLMGAFRLEITPPADGSTIGTIRSTGMVLDSDAPSRIIEAQIGYPNLAKYAFLTESDVWFGDTESVDGKVHSNGGIRFDGIGNDEITSAKQTYICQPEHGCPEEEKPGIWGTGGPDSFWRYPTSAIPFNKISGDLAGLEDLADEDGILLGDSKKYGWHIDLHSNNTATSTDDWVDIYKVTKVYTTSGWIPTDEGGEWVDFEDDIKTQGSKTTYPMPGNGVIYVDDKVWVSGETSSRVTIAAAHFEEVEDEWRDIIIAGDISYYAEDGTAVVSLLAQGDVRVSYYSEDNLEIDAVLLAQRGRVIRPYYTGSVKSSITTYGSLITYGIWTWSWVDGWGNIISGYTNTNSNYDPHLVYSPPPNFPSTNEYQILYWEEVLPE